MQCEVKEVSWESQMSKMLAATIMKTLMYTYFYALINHDMKTCDWCFNVFIYRRTHAEHLETLWYTVLPTLNLK